MFKNLLGANRAVEVGLASNQLFGDYSGINQRYVLGLLSTLMFIYIYIYYIS